MDTRDKEVLNMQFTLIPILAKAFLPHMKEQGWGRIVCINTECAYVPIRGGRVMPGI